MSETVQVNSAPSIISRSDFDTFRSWYSSLSEADLGRVLKKAEEILLVDAKPAAGPAQISKKGRQRRGLLAAGLGVGLTALGGGIALGATSPPSRGSQEISAPSYSPTASPTEIPIPSPTPPPTLEPSPTSTIVKPTSTPIPTSTPKPETKISPEKQGVIPPRDERILHPAEMKYDQVEPWLDRLRGNHDAVLTESLFTREIASMSNQLQEEVMQALAKAHADAIIEQYKDTEAIIGLDPGHGGDDIGSVGLGSAGRTYMEKDLTWKLTNLIAEQIYQKTLGKYRVIILRPQDPKDQDLNRDGAIAPAERLQKRIALLYDMEEKLRPDPKTRGKNLALVSIHFNDSASNNKTGTETYYPNPTGMSDIFHRESSKALAIKIQENMIYNLSRTGYKDNVSDRGAKEDPDQRPQPPNINIQVGPYFLLSENRPNQKLR